MCCKPSGLKNMQTGLTAKPLTTRLPCLTDSLLTGCRFHHHQTISLCSYGRSENGHRLITLWRASSQPHPGSSRAEQWSANPPMLPTARLRGRKAVSQRKRRLQRTNYLCEMCIAEGHIRLATVVDHKIPLSKGGPDTDDNTRNLCDEHNRKVTAEQFGYRTPQTIGKDGWPTS